MSETSLVLDLTNLVYESEANRAYPITGLFSSAVSHVGITVARTGITTGRQAGTVASTNETVRVCDANGVSCVTLSNQSAVRACALPGDSGGSVYRANQGVGIVSSSNFQVDGLGDPVCHSTSPMYWYTKLDVALSALGAGILTK